VPEGGRPSLYVAQDLPAGWPPSASFEPRLLAAPVLPLTGLSEGVMPLDRPVPRAASGCRSHPLPPGVCGSTTPPRMRSAGGWAASLRRPSRGFLLRVSRGPTRRRPGKLLFMSPLYPRPFGGDQLPMSRGETGATCDPGLLVRLVTFSEFPHIMLNVSGWTASLRRSADYLGLEVPKEKGLRRTALPPRVSRPK